MIGSCGHEIKGSCPKCLPTVADRVEQLYRGERITMKPECSRCSHLKEDCRCSDETPKGYREFTTGASRDTAIGKLDVARYIHPLVIKRFAQYMLEKQTMPDGTTRSGDNWQKGIPPQELLSSLQRHNLDIWEVLVGPVGPPEGDGEAAESILKDALPAALFNIMALMLHLEKGTVLT